MNSLLCYKIFLEVCYEKLNCVLKCLIMFQVILLVSCSEDEKSPTGPDSTHGKIAFASDKDGNLELYVMDADGTNQTWLTKIQLLMVISHGRRFD